MCSASVKAKDCNGLSFSPRCGVPLLPTGSGQARGRRGRRAPSGWAPVVLDSNRLDVATIVGVHRLSVQPTWSIADHRPACASFGVLGRGLDRGDLPRARRTRGLSSMHVAMTGSHGLVGSALVPFLTTGGHRVTRLVRRAPVGPNEAVWDPARGLLDASRLDGIDAVVHLAGANIAAGRWTPARKAEIRRQPRGRHAESVRGAGSPAAPAEGPRQRLRRRILRGSGRRDIDGRERAGKWLPRRRLPRMGGGHRARLAGRHPGGHISDSE